MKYLRLMLEEEWTLQVVSFIYRPLIQLVVIFIMLITPKRDILLWVFQIHYVYMPYLVVLQLEFMTKMKTKYYSLQSILSYNAIYNIIFGERSNGKTYSVLDLGLKNYCERGEQLAIIRRWNDDFTGKRGQQMFESLVNNGLVEKYSNGSWNNVYYYSSRWYLCKFDDKLNKRIVDDKPFAYAFSLNSVEHDKSTSYPNVTTIMFDEFLTRKYYLPDEFVLFTNTLSTIIRDRDNVKIFMLGNTVNKICPYFNEMGLNGNEIGKMKKGTIDVYTYGVGEDGEEFKIAVEYSDFPQKKKKSDKYFAFDNPKLKMITQGAWEIPMYPHLPYKYKSYECTFKFFIEYEGNVLQGNYIHHGKDHFLFFHMKTTPIKNDNDLVFSQKYSPNPYHFRKITSITHPICKKLYWFFKNDKVFYQSNDVGELIRNYLVWCQHDVAFT